MLVMRPISRYSVHDIEASEFQDTIARSVEGHLYPYVVNINGTPFTIFPETLNPVYAKAAMLLINNLGVSEGDVVLDPFTGCGADAIFSVMAGAGKAVAIDKYIMPALCARYNVHMAGLDNKVEVALGDLFDPLVEGEDEFDIIVENPPFRNKQITRQIHTAQMDPDYTTLHRFFNEYGNWLRPEGRIRMVFSDVGDLKGIKRMADDAWLSVAPVAEDRYASEVAIEVLEMRRK